MLVAATNLFRGDGQQSQRELPNKADHKRTHRKRQQAAKHAARQDAIQVLRAPLLSGDAIQSANHTQMLPIASLLNHRIRKPGACVKRRAPCVCRKHARSRVADGRMRREHHAQCRCEGNGAVACAHGESSADR